MKALRYLLLGAAVAIAAPLFAVPFKNPGASGGVADTGGYPEFGTTYKVAVTSSSGAVDLTSAGTYTILCEEAAHAAVGSASTITATTSNRPIPADAPYPLLLRDGENTGIAFIRDTADGDCYVSRDVYR